MDAKDDAKSMEEPRAGTSTTSDSIDLTDICMLPFQKSDKKTLRLVERTIVRCKDLPAGSVVEQVAKVIGLTVQRDIFPHRRSGHMHVISLVGHQGGPLMAHLGHSPERAAKEMLAHLVMSLRIALERAFPPQEYPPYA